MIGIHRVAPCNRGDDTMKISLCVFEDVKEIYETRFDNESVGNSFDQCIPTVKNHIRYFATTIKDPNTTYYKGSIGSQFIGYVRFVNTNKGIGVSVAIHPRHRGKGYSTKLILGAIEQYGYSDLMYVEIKLYNVKSFRVFAEVSGNLKLPAASGGEVK